MELTVTNRSRAYPEGNREEGWRKVRKYSVLKVQRSKMYPFLELQLRKNDTAYKKQYFFYLFFINLYKKSVFSLKNML